MKLSWMNDYQQELLVSFPYLPPSMFFTSPTGVPSCLKPVAQQAAGGLEAMMKVVDWGELSVLRRCRKQVQLLNRGSEEILNRRELEQLSPIKSSTGPLPSNKHDTVPLSFCNLPSLLLPLVQSQAV
jgi:hypothetical protein